MEDVAYNGFGFDANDLNEIGRQSRDFSHGKDSPSILQNATIKIQIKGVNTNDKREKATLIPKQNTRTSDMADVWQQPICLEPVSGNASRAI